MHFDSINFQANSPQVQVGPRYGERKSFVATFYINLIVQYHLLHNNILDFGASHNLMSKIIEEKLWLEITRPNKDLYSFWIEMIKDLVVNLAQIPIKSVMMDVVVANVLVSYVILLSKYWEEKVGGTL